MPEGHYSVVTFELKKNGKGTKLKFIYMGVLKNQVKGIDSVWKEFYLEKMKIAE
ncbi:MAG: hypothetical protein KGH67_03865 [Candidatus Micrarchaeota archaeon]|nr:hypothetical protein [Candidatus Micrarchaeota archaeon]